MTRDFTKSKYFNYLLSNFEELDKNRVHFNKDICDLLNAQTDELGTVLKCHLIIEYYIDSYLAASYPTIINWKNVRLSFSQKLELVKNEQTSLGMYYASIKSLNSIRNKFSHKLSYKITPDDYKEIEFIMDAWYKALNKQLIRGLYLIENFTIWVCGNIDILIKGINKQSPKLGLPAYLQWLEDMQLEDK